MNGTFKMSGFAAVLALAACGPQEPKEPEQLEVKAEEMEGAAARAQDGAQAEVLENQAESLRKAAKGEEKAETKGTVTVIKE